MTQRLKTNLRAFALGMLLGAIALFFTLMMEGCGTVRGIGDDIMRASDGIRDAMAEE